MGVWTRIDGKEKIVWFQVVVEIVPGDAWLEGYVHIMRSESDYFVHFLERDCDGRDNRDALTNVNSEIKARD